MEEILFCKGGGCAAKLGAGVLSRILEKLPKALDDENLLVGYDSHDDAAVYKISEDTAIVLTLDFFPPMIEDPYLFGKVAATNALSDIYAMGGEVKTALNIVCFPESMDLNILGKIMQGGAEVVREAGGVLCGGHSIAGEDVKYGLSVMGTVDPKSIAKNDTPIAGDVLILTKKLGTGLVCTAERVKEAEPGAIEAAIESMTTLNRSACEIGTKHTVHACTDVTGFSLLGHLHEMLGGTLAAVIMSSEVPVLPGALSAAENFLYTAGGQRNRNYVGDNVVFMPEVSFAMQEVLFDPQTSGGLLFAVPEKEKEEMLKELRDCGLPAAAIGYITEKKISEITVR